MTDQITWRTTDGSRWGAGKGSRLSKTEIDINFWVLLSRMLTVEHAVQAAGVGIHDFQVTGDQFTVILTDNTQLGPYTLPAVTWNFTNPPTGAWVASYSYSKYDVFSANNKLYAVQYDHISGSSFSAAANDGNGHDYYELLLNLNTQPPTQTQTGSTWTPTIYDAFTYNRFTNPAGCAITLPANSSVAFPIDTEIYLRDQTQSGAGITVDATSPAAINGISGFINQSAAVGATIGLKKVATDSWDIFGHLLEHP